LETAYIPTHLEKATVYIEGMTVTVTGSGPIQTPQQPKPQTDYSTFETSWHCEYRVEGSAHALKQAILQGVAVAVSDGSYQMNAGAAAWTIEGHTVENRICGAGKCQEPIWTTVRIIANYLDYGVS